MDLPVSGVEPDGSAVVRVLSYNVRSLRDDTTALTRVVRACEPDVVCVQEAPRFFRWRKHAARLARDCGLVYVTGGATAAGPMILTHLRATVDHTEDLLLPLTPGLHRRGLATAVLRFGTAARLVVASFHLSLAARERYGQAGLLLRHLTETARQRRVSAVVAAGDVNEQPDGPAFRRLAGELRDCRAVKPWGGEPTVPVRHPQRRIDAVFASPQVTVLGCGVPRKLPGVAPRDLERATDHLPVLAALRVPPAPAG